MIVLQGVKPFESAFLNNLETFNEFVNFLSLVAIMCFSDFVPDAETRSEVGRVLIGIIIFYVVVHTKILIVGAIMQVKLYFRRKCFKVRKTNGQKKSDG